MIKNSMKATHRCCSRRLPSSARTRAAAGARSQRSRMAFQSAKQMLNGLTMTEPDAMRADARRFQQLVRADAVKTRTATLFEQGLQTRGPLELDVGDCIGALSSIGR